MDNPNIINPDYDALTGPRRAAIVVILLMVGFVIIFVFWASFSKLVVSVRAVGQVIPHSQIQTVENLEGGILAELLANPGDLVVKNQILARIDDTVISSSLREDVIRYLANVATVDRLTAELRSRRRITFSSALTEPLLVSEGTAANIRNEALAIFQRRVAEYDSTLSRMQSEVDRIEEQIAGSQQQQDNLLEQRQFTAELLKIAEAQADQGLISNTEVLKLQRQIAEVTGKSGEQDLRLASLRGDLISSRARIVEYRNQRQSRNQSDLQTVRVERDALQQNLKALSDRVRRREVRSPVDGVVQRLLITTIGGVLQPGDPIMEIIPVDDDLLISARIRPSDRANLRSGMEAFVRITAYDASVYNALPGLVERISADTLKDPNTGASHYEIVIRVDEDRISARQLEETPIRPGMEAQIDVVTGDRTVLAYILKPLLKLRERALREP